MAYVVVVNYVVVGLFLAYSFLAYSFFGLFLAYIFWLFLDVNSRLKKPFVGSKPKYHI